MKTKNPPMKFETFLKYLRAELREPGHTAELVGEDKELYLVIKIK